MHKKTKQHLKNHTFQPYQRTILKKKRTTPTESAGIKKQRKKTRIKTNPNKKKNNNVPEHPATFPLEHGALKQNSALCPTCFHAELRVQHQTFITSGVAWPLHTIFISLGVYCCGGPIHTQVYGHTLPVKLHTTQRKQNYGHLNPRSIA